MDIDVIKWMIGYADGFEWIEPDRIGMPHGTWTVNDSCKDNPSWNFLIYPLLLQRAIEGVNRCNIYNKSESKILVNLYVYESITKNGSELYDIDWANPGKAKEASLKYVWEQENAK